MDSYKGICRQYFHYSLHTASGNYATAVCPVNFGIVSHCFNIHYFVGWYGNIRILLFYYYPELALLLLRCDWAYVRQSKGFGQVAPFFSVTNWYSPIKLRKIYHLAKFLSHLFHWKSETKAHLRPHCSRYKITHFSTMRPNLKWKSRGCRPIVFGAIYSYDNCGRIWFNA